MNTIIAEASHNYGGMIDLINYYYERFDDKSPDHIIAELYAAKFGLQATFPKDFPATVTSFRIWSYYKLDLTGSCLRTKLPAACISSRSMGELYW